MVQQIIDSWPSCEKKTSLEEVQILLGYRKMTPYWIPDEKV